MYTDDTRPDQERNATHADLTCQCKSLAGRLKMCPNLEAPSLRRVIALQRHIPHSPFVLLQPHALCSPQPARYAPSVEHDPCMLNTDWAAVATGWDSVQTRFSDYVANFGNASPALSDFLACVEQVASVLLPALVHRLCGDRLSKDFSNCLNQFATFLKSDKGAAVKTLSSDALLDLFDLQPFVLGMRVLQKQVEEPNFETSCTLHAQWCRRSVPQNLQFYLSADARAPLCRAFQDLLTELSAPALFNRFANTLRSQLLPMLGSFVTALQQVHTNLPIILNLGDLECRRRYAAGLPSQYVEMAGLLEQAGLAQVARQVRFMIDVHALLQDVAVLRDAACWDKTPDERKLTGKLVSQVGKVQVKLLALASAPNLSTSSGSAADAQAAWRSQRGWDRGP